MPPLFKSIARFLKSEGGPTSVEYAVMLALILLAAVQMIMLLGGSNSTGWQRNANEIISATSGTGAGG